MSVFCYSYYKHNKGEITGKKPHNKTTMHLHIGSLTLVLQIRTNRTDRVFLDFFRNASQSVFESAL